MTTHTPAGAAAADSHRAQAVPAPRCRRTKACSGEPAECLAVYLPLLPHEALAGVLSLKQVRRRGRRNR